MGMLAKKSKLHNFNLPPFLKWGNPRLLRCMNQNPNEVNPSAAAANRKPSPLKIGSPRNKHRSIKKKKKKMGFNLSPSPVVGSRSGLRIRVVDGKKDEGIVDLEKEGQKLSCPVPVPAPAPVEGDSFRPWNLRTRRSASKTLMGGNGGGNGLNNLENRERPKFSVCLSRQEIEDDFLAMTGKLPPRKLKKRPRNVQKKLDTLFPGLLLREVKPEMYNAPGSVDYKKL